MISKGMKFLKLILIYIYNKNITLNLKKYNEKINNYND